VKKPKNPDFLRFSVSPFLRREDSRAGKIEEGGRKKLKKNILSRRSIFDKIQANVRLSRRFSPEAAFFGPPSGRERPFSVKIRKRPFQRASGAVGGRDRGSSLRAEFVFTYYKLFTVIIFF
jgi:hypothetical protein